MTHTNSLGAWPPRASGSASTSGLLGAGLALGAAAAWSGVELCRYLGRKTTQDTASLQGYGYTGSL